MEKEITYVDIFGSLDKILIKVPNPDIVKRALKKKGISCLKDLCELKDSELTGIPGLGAHGFLILKEELSSHGLSFGMTHQDCVDYVIEYFKTKI